MYLPADEAGPSTSGQEDQIVEEVEEEREEDRLESPQFSHSTPPQTLVLHPEHHHQSRQHLQVPRLKTSPTEEAEDQEEEEEKPLEPVVKPEPVKKPPGPVRYIGPDEFLSLDRNYQSLRHPQIAGNALRIQQRLIGQLEQLVRSPNGKSSSKEEKPNKEELKKMLTQMTKKLRLLEVATGAGRAVASHQGYDVCSIMGLSRPPEEKPLIPPRRLQFGRKKSIGIDGTSSSSLLSPKPDADKTPKRTPVVPIRKPLNQPPLIQTPIPMYPEVNSPPLENHYDLSDLPNGHENNNHEETPITPPLALNKGKRKAASGIGILPLSASINSVGEKSEKRPKRAEGGQLKKRTSNRLSKPRVTAKEEDEPTYCFCSRVSFGEMIGCDNDKCEIEWFHFECIGLTTKPKGKWFCPNCRHPDSAKMPKTAPLPKIIKELKREMIMPEM